MNGMLEFLQSSGASRLGEVMVHFFWQGAAVAAVLAVLLVGLRRASAWLRYWIAVAALAALALLPVVTWFGLSGTPWVNLAPAVFTFRDSHPGVVENGSEPAYLLVSWAQPVLPWLTLGWLAGAAFLVVRLVGGGWQAQRLGKVATQPVGSPWPEKVVELATRLGVRRSVRLLESLQVHTPVVLGWLSPIILLPTGLIGGIAPAHLEALLAHELAHLRRHDYFVNCLQRVVEALLFYHPAVWWVSERVRRERELCCDDLAAEVLGDRRVLAEALVTLAERESVSVGLALAATGGSLTERVKRLLNVPRDGAVVSLSTYGLTLLLSACLGAAVLWLSQQGFPGSQPAQESAPPALASLSLTRLTDQLAQLDAKVARQQDKVDTLVSELQVPDAMVEDSGPFSSHTNPERKAELLRRVVLGEEAVRSLRAKAPADLIHALGISHPTPLLTTLLSDRAIAEQQKAQLSSELTSPSPQLERTDRVLATIEAQLDDVVNAQMESLQAQLDSDRAALAGFSKQSEQGQVDWARETLQYRPYFREKKDLDTLLRMREAMRLQLVQERINARFSPSGSGRRADPASPK